MLARQLAGAEDRSRPLVAGGEGLDRLDALDTGDPATSLWELFSWSFRQLSKSAAEMFALLGVHCGPDITVPAAASLAGFPAPARGAGRACRRQPGL